MEQSTTAALDTQTRWRNNGSAWRLGRGTACALALLAAIAHAEERPIERGASDVFYVSVMTVRDDGGGRDRRTAAARADSECGWDDPPPGATVVCDSAVVEGAERPFAFRNVNEDGEPVPAETDLEIQYRTVPISAMAGEDYVGDEAMLTIKAGEIVSPVVTVTTLDDQLDEFEEIFAVELSSDSEIPVVLEFDYLVIPIQDNDPQVSVSLRGDEVEESAGTLSFEVSLSAMSGKTVSVDYATSDGTAMADTDYRPIEDTLTFEPGEVRKTVEVDIVDDTVYESTEWFTLALTNGRNGRLSGGPARGVIQDDEAFLTVADSTADEASGELEFVVTASRLSAGDPPVNVDYATEDGTATAGADYEAVSGTLAFTAERLEQTIAVPVTDDGIDEPDETLTVVLSKPVNAALKVEVVEGTILDDDPYPQLRIEGGSAEEGETLGFVVTLSGSTSREVTVDYATEDASAMAGADYGAVSGTLTFAPGESNLTVAVDIVDDDTYEPEETFLARLSSPVNAVLSTGEATGTIVDNDEEPATVAILPEGPVLCVGGAPARIDLARHFSGGGLSYSISSPDPGVATANLDAAVLVLTPVAEGTTSMTATASNVGSQAMFELTVTVVADPAELAAIGKGLAVVGGAILAEVTDGISERFAGADVFDRGTHALPLAQGPRQDRRPAYLFAGGESADAVDIPGREAFGMRQSFRPLVSMPLAVDSPDSSTSPVETGNWSLWGRGSTRRLEAGESLRDGTLTAWQAGADTRVGEWLLGASAGLARAEADYGFVRSVDACGGAGSGEGALETEVASFHPYVGRRVGRGWIWGTAGVGSGEAVVERCTSGQRSSADLSMRMGALGGRHVIGGSDRLRVSLVEDVGVLRATTAAGVGPASDHNVSVGRARFGLEVTGLCSVGAGIVGWARGFVRHDWGDGIEGSGAEVALGARLNAPEKRLRLEAGLHAVAAHAEDDYEELGANILAAYLPRPDGTGLQVSLALRQGTPGETHHWAEDWQRSIDRREARSAMRGNVFVGFGFRTVRGLAGPFAAVETSSRGRRVAAGLRYEALGGLSGLLGELSIGHRQGVGDGSFMMARIEARR